MPTSPTSVAQQFQVIPQGNHEYLRGPQVLRLPSAQFAQATLLLCLIRLTRALVLCVFLGWVGFLIVAHADRASDQTWTLPTFWTLLAVTFFLCLCLMAATWLLEKKLLKRPWPGLFPTWYPFIGAPNHPNRQARYFLLPCSPESG